MANWPYTQFETTDLDIVNEIRRGVVKDFSYNEKLGRGHCNLQWGLCSIDLDEIEQLAIAGKSSFKIMAFDIWTDQIQDWEFKDGVEIVAEVRKWGVREPEDGKEDNNA